MNSSFLSDETDASFDSFVGGLQTYLPNELDFSLVFPRDEATRNPSLKTPIDINEREFLLGRELTELNTNELEDFFTQLESSSGNSKLSWSVRSDDVFTGSTASLANLLLGESISEPQTKKSEGAAIGEVLVASEPVPVTSATAETSEIEQKLQILATPSAHCKRKQNFKLATLEGDLAFIEDSPVASAQPLPIQEEVSNPTQCPGCQRSFKKLNQHRCKVLAKSSSEPTMSQSLRQKFMCGACLKTFRAEKLFVEHVAKCKMEKEKSLKQKKVKGTKRE